METGLLEQTTLLMLPAGSGCRILDTERHPVGFTRWQSPVWWRRGPLSLLEVHEEDQAPLLCLIARRWTLLASYEVLDAEGERIGVIEGRRIHDCWNRLTMYRQGEEFCDREGHRVARVKCVGGERQLEFGPTIQADPFAKMLVVSAVLVQ